MHKCTRCKKKFEEEPHLDKRGRPFCDTCYRELMRQRRASKVSSPTEAERPSAPTAGKSRKKIIAASLAVIFLIAIGGIFLAQGPQETARRKLEGEKIAFDSNEFAKRAEQGEAATVELFLQAGMNPDEKDSEGVTALVAAASAGNRENLLTLCDRSFEAYHKGNDPWRQSPSDTWREFLNDIEPGHTEVIVTLLNNGADPNVRSKNGTTALMWASYRGNVEAVRALLGNGADPSAQDNDGVPPLGCAANTGRTEIVRLLLDAGADVHAKDKKYGYTTLAVAAEKGYTEIVTSLLQKGAEVNFAVSQGKTPLMLAAAYRHEEIVSHLLEKGAYVKTRDQDGSSALLFAVNRRTIDKKCIDIAKVLLAKGADPNANNVLGVSASKGNREIVELLLQNGADPNAKGGAWSALWYAAWLGYTDVAKLLLEHGADANGEGQAGTKPLHFAVRNGHSEIVKMLLDNGANTDLQFPLLMSAAAGGYTEIVKALIAKGTDVNARGENGETALMYAAGYRFQQHVGEGNMIMKQVSADTVRVLLDNGADISVKTKDGETALMIAAKAGHAEIRELLKKARETKSYY